MKTRITAAVLATMSLSVGGCATISRGTTDVLHVDTNPGGGTNHGYE